MNTLMVIPGRLQFAGLLLCAVLAACGGERDPILGVGNPGNTGNTGGTVATAPVVTAVTPADASTGVLVDVASATATFNEPLTGAAGTTFTVLCTTPCVSPSGATTLDSTGRVLSFTFTAGTRLDPATPYAVSVNGARSQASGLAMSAARTWTFTTGTPPDIIRPRVALTRPVTSVPGPTPAAAADAPVIAGFSEDMDVASILAAGTFTLACSLPCTAPAGTVTYDAGSRSATFSPTVALATGTTYTATISAAAKDLAGNALAGNQAALPAASAYIWSFTTGLTLDTTRPQVTLTAPLTSSPGPTPGTALNARIAATFSEDMRPATLSATTFTVTCVSPCVNPVGTVSYDLASRTALFSHVAPLAAATTYTATLTTGALDLAGNALAGNPAALPAASNYVWTFSTGAAADLTGPTVTARQPADNAVGVCVNKTVNVTFSEAMDPASISISSFTLTSSAGSVVGVVSYNALTRIASFNPVADLTGTPATQYTVTVLGGSAGVKDLAGNPMLANATSVFTTNASRCATAPPLGAAAAFGAFGGNATLTNDGLATVINGDIGVNAPSTTITGLRDTGGNVYTVTPSNDGLVNGLIYSLTAPPLSVAALAVTAARVDALAAFNAISPALLPGGIDVSSLAQCASCGGAGGGPDELAGRTLPPGIYLSTAGTFDIGGAGRTTANLTLDAGGDVDAVWIFQSAAGTGTLNVGVTGPATPAVPIRVLLINGAEARNVFWYVPAGATIGTGATMVGSMLADAAITVSTTGGSPPTAVVTTLNGRALSLTSGVTITNTVVTLPPP